CVLPLLNWTGRAQRERGDWSRRQTPEQLRKAIRRLTALCFWLQCYWNVTITVAPTNLGIALCAKTLPPCIPGLANENFEVSDPVGDPVREGYGPFSADTEDDT
ncbi:hypothetical protein DNTS_033917, partial [Danionella cerebrum]